MAWQPHDLDRLAAAIDTLRELDVWSVYLTGFMRPRVHVSRESLADIARMTGIRPTVVPRPGYGNYEAIIAIGRHLRLHAIFPPEHLPQIGYRVPAMPKPVPINEEVDTDDDVSD